MDISNVLKQITSKEVNVNDEERLLSSFTGGLMLAQALMGNRNPLKMAAGGYLLYRGLTGHCSAYAQMNKIKNEDANEVTISTSLTVNKPVAEVYAAWRELENLPDFMTHLESVTVTGNKTSVWKAAIPGGLGTVEWQATIVEDLPNERISWRSNEGATIQNEGTVNFKSVGYGATEIVVGLAYSAPAGKIGEGIARLLNPVFERMILQDIANFTQYIETGGIHAMAGLPTD
jgi:uncharacterized membrane protein